MRQHSEHDEKKLCETYGVAADQVRPVQAARVRSTLHDTDTRLMPVAQTQYLLPLQEWDPTAPGYHQCHAYLWMLVSKADAKRYFKLTDAYMDGRPM